MPFFYTYGLSIINTHLNVGASIVVTNEKVIEKKFWQIFKEKKITNFGGVPYFYEILRKLKFDKMKLPSLKYFTQAGGHLSTELVKYFYNYTVKYKKLFIIMYGQTEATSRMTYLPYKFINKKIGSIVIPIPNGKINLDKKDGEIIYKGKNVSLGYALNYKDLSKSDENNQILRTGDLAKKDKDGFVYITGRKLREIKIYGHRINLDELEMLLKNRGIKCACLGLNDKIIIFHNQKIHTKIWKIVSDFTTLNLNYFKIYYIKKIPINENNKTSYKKLEKLL
jgi:acyl-coenzyme A synthetase/AMP-(fatty) acid ligase